MMESIRPESMPLQPKKNGLYSSSCSRLFSHKLWWENYGNRRRHTKQKQVISRAQVTLAYYMANRDKSVINMVTLAEELIVTTILRQRIKNNIVSLITSSYKSDLDNKKGLAPPCALKYMIDMLTKSTISWIFSKAICIARVD